MVYKPPSTEIGLRFDANVGVFCGIESGGNGRNGLAQDLRYVLRQLRKSPGFAMAAVVALASAAGSIALGTNNFHWSPRLTLKSFASESLGVIP